MPDEATATGPAVWPALYGALAAFAGLVCTVVWVATGGPFWPAWVWLGLAISAALVVWAGRVRAGDEPLALHAGLAGIVFGGCVGAWVVEGAPDSFWPIWVGLSALTLLGVHAIVDARDRLPGAERERVLSARVDRLEETRRGALDVQAAELRRIERDLHDGAQARLVALTMRLGRAEARLDDDPEAAALVREARDDATAAIAELRDLARGIAPPVLADRGLAAAIEALGVRASVDVEVNGTLRRRLPPVVESAAYFVVAEALTNVAKHAPHATATVTFAERGGALEVVVADDGPGGAIPTGSGLSGLRQRVEALDGRFTVHSPSDRGTRVEVVLPCGS